MINLLGDNGFKGATTCSLVAITVSSERDVVLEISRIVALEGLDSFATLYLQRQHRCGTSNARVAMRQYVSAPYPTVNATYRSRCSQDVPIGLVRLPRQETWRKAESPSSSDLTTAVLAGPGKCRNV